MIRHSMANGQFSIQSSSLMKLDYSVVIILQHPYKVGMLPKDDKPQHNQLIGRLFKHKNNKVASLSKSGLGPTLQMNHSINTSTANLQDSFQSPPHSNFSSNKYLIPKITKQKLKPLDRQEGRLPNRTKIFSNHLNSSKSIADKSDRGYWATKNLSKVRSKIYSHLDQIHSLDEQISRPPVTIADTVKLSQVNYKEENNSKNRKNTDDEQDNHITPSDFMNFLKIDRDMSDEFCYMNRKGGPYDWEIVEFERREPNEYMVISKRGLTKYFHQEVEFINFQHFLSEQKTYNRLQQIYYFRIYKKYKYFQLWKRLTSFNIFKARSREFSEKTLLNDVYLKAMLLEVHDLCRKAQNIDTFYTQTLSACRLEEFQAYRQKEREKTLNILRAIEQAILSIMLEKSDTSMEVFMKKMRISRDNKKVGQKKISLLIGDESGKDMPYTQSATLRTHQIKVRNFLKLADYLMITSKTQLVINMVKSLSKNLQEINELYEEQKKGLGSLSWIQTEVQEQDGQLIFNPPNETLSEEIEEIVYSTLSSICQEHFQFLHLEQFDEFWQCSIEAEKTDEHIEIKGMISINPEFNQSIKKFKREVKRNFSNVEQYSKIFERSLDFLAFLRSLEHQNYQEKNTDFFKEVMFRCKVEMQSLQEIQSNKEVGILLLKCGNYELTIQKQCEAAINELHRVVPDILNQRAHRILEEIKHHYDLIGLNPISIQQYIIFLKNYRVVSDFVERIGPDLLDNSDLLSMTDSYSMKVAEPIKAALGDSNSNMIGLRRRLDEIGKSSSDTSEKFKKDIQKLIPTFDDRVKAHLQKLQAIDPLKNSVQMHKKVALIKQLSESLAAIVSDKQKLQKYQEQLGLPITVFEGVEDHEKYFGYIELLWDQKILWEEFNTNIYEKGLCTIDFEQTCRYLEQLQKRITTFQRELEPNEAVQDFKHKLEKFTPLYYACQALMNPKLQEKHFMEIKELIRARFRTHPLPISADELENMFTDMQNCGYTLKFFQCLEVDKLQSEIINISVKAEKEFELTGLIMAVEAIWKSIGITAVAYKEGKDIILGNNDDLITKIDDNLLAVNNILGSKFVGPIKARVEVQSKMLRYMQDLIDEWYLHQKNWIYLQPILKSPFALKNLPKETAMFNQIDSKWKNLMKTAKDAINIKRYAEQMNSSYTLRILRANNEAFEIIHKTLEHFLEKKRDIFQRFYFLSNDELLEILSTVKDFPQIEPHLSKVFENFVKLEFDQKGLPVNMGSLEGETIPLKNCIFRGEVEEWFKSAEESMKLTLRSLIRNSFQRFAEVKRKEWVYMYPSQIVLVVDCIMWTSITQGYLEEIESSGESEIEKWCKVNKQQLSQLVAEIIRPELGSLERKKLVALITQDVHYRDIVEMLQECEGPHDFKWLQQLRFYNMGESVLARQVQAELYYGYEYLGATTRLVITPLTDRCWMTITGALHIKLGANPAGPAGTGKTESCKDLAKSLGRYCIVFNCSDQINAQMMEKLFSGLAYTGSWTCLDEFNRIDIEVLSVIAQQVLTIRQSLLLGKSNRQLVLGGKSITLNHDLGIFITMNPGYAGRTELPDNLKTLFRPVAMMVPDYTLIAQIMLFSEGFIEAKPLSKKMTKLYKLSSEQLSQQDHYDFGMRAVKSVLVMAGSLKRAQPNVNENIILIRAMQDSNIPKFLSQDIPLFNDIIDDMFPGVRIPQQNQTQIIDKIRSNCIQNSLIASSKFTVKILQLNETLKVRFGVMLVGPPMSSKTSMMKTLLDEMPIIINPKSVSLPELYGNFDPFTQTWTDGLAAKLLRQSTISHQYVCFDGPVDAIWVQNLNTVLDDSMMLCLSNGERIKLNFQMRILFEVNDLNQASPATVSRCGMVWVAEDVVDWEQLIDSFFLQHSQLIRDRQKLEYLTSLMKISIRKGYAYISKFCKPMVKLNKSTVIHSYCKFLKNHIDLLPQKALEAQTWKKSLEKLCIYAYTWSIGANLSEDSKARLDKSLSECFSAESCKSPIVNFTLSYKQKLEGEWISWNFMLPGFQFPEGLSFSEIFVPTKETYCYTSIIEKFVKKLDPVFLTAPTGTGKTSMTSQILRKSEDASLLITFTAQTSPSVAQIQLESKLQNQRKAGNITLIPPPGKNFVCFIDDINMPAIEVYGAQPPIEMLRLLLGTKGVWDRKLLNFKGVEGMEMIVAGTHGRAELSPRFVRFFNTIYIPDLQDESLVIIFFELVRGFFGRMKIRNQVMELIDNKSIVHSTLGLYSDIKRQLLPTPEKSHYLFNLRDVSRVIQGLTVVKQSTLTSPEVLAKLWVHEFQRVFEDRLSTERDRQFIRQELGKKITVSIKSSLSAESIFEQPIVFCHFMKKGVQRKNMAYEEVHDLTKLTKVIGDSMQEETKMNLVLFADAVMHICRISRCFLFERGHIVLVGLSGSGKKSLISLGAVLAQSVLKTVEIRKNYGRNEFREDLFAIMKKASFENEQVAFLFPENHMLQDSFLEDINNLLSSGEVPCMLNKENIEEITQAIGYQTFLKRVIANLHVCLTLSPIGQQFRSRVRNFPSLVNCCLMDWVEKWPEEALLNVGKMILEEKSVCVPCVFIHKQMERLSSEFLLATRRKIFITPKNYIELLQSFNIFLHIQKSKNDSSISKLSNGVHKLVETSELIEKLKVKLTELRPVLQGKTVQQENLLAKLEIDRREAGEAKEVIQQEEKVIAEKTQKALMEKKEADRILSEALPTLHAATEALNTLNRNDISQIKMNQNPHAQVKFTLQAVSILLQQKQQWEAIRKTISDINFITRLKNLDVYNIPLRVEEIIKKKIKTNPNFRPYEIKQINFAAKSLCEWVLAVVNFTDVNKEIVKKKTLLKKLNGELEISNKELQVKRDQLAGIIDKVKELERMFNESREQKEQLDQEMILTGRRLVNAQELTDGLKNEKVRWAEYLLELEEDKKSMVGNTFLATCFVVYSGPYTGRYRSLMLEKCCESLQKQGIKYKQNWQLREIFGDNLEIQKWIGSGLPKDSVSIDSAILVNKTLQNPIMIDPQLQASKWIKKELKSSQLKQLRVGSSNFLKSLESCLLTKIPVMLENPQDSIDPAIDCLLSKDYEHTNNRYFVKMGDSRIEIDPDLRIYLYTKTGNPHFSPDVYIKLCVINFTVTPEGLEDQLLADVVQNELPEIEQQRRYFLNVISEGRITLQNNEDKILELLNDSKGNVLDDIELITNLKESKKVGNEVKMGLEETMIKSKEIEEARMVYQPVAKRGAILYLIISELLNVETMYQFSLEYFTRIFVSVLRSKVASSDTQLRVDNLINQLTKTVYSNISRALFNQHKKIFSFMIAIRVQQVPKKEYDYFSRGDFSLGADLSTPPQYIPGLKEQVSISLHNLSKVFDNEIYEVFMKGGEKTLATYNLNPFKAFQAHGKLVGSQQPMTSFQHLIVTKVMSPELTLEAISLYISKALGEEFVRSETPTMNSMYTDISNKVPLVFILSVGADPLQNLLKLSRELGKTNEQLLIISLGQGQGVPALKAINYACEQGGWVILQNCHLGKSFMPALEKRLEEINESTQVSQNFRLFLTSMPCDYFPVTILQNSLKVTSEPPRGIKANLKQIINNITWKQSNNQKTLAFSLCFFHAIVVERKKFGSLGWNILYDFNASDLETSLTIVSNLMEDYEEPPWDAIEYFIGQIVYGGRVTDDFDRRLLQTMLKDYISPQCLQKPKVVPGPPQNYLNFVNKLSEEDPPQLFGMSSNAQKIYLIKVAKQAMDVVHMLEPQQASSNDTSKTLAMIEELVKNVPPVLKGTLQDKKNPDATDICLEQESMRFNQLISFINGNLKSLIQAVKGEILMTDALENTFTSLRMNNVPTSWQKKAYPSVKPFSSWFSDLVERVAFFRKALLTRPNVYWISAFYFPQGFLTSVLQIHARKLEIPIDSLNFQFVFKQTLFKETADNNTSEGCLIYGLYSEACAIDFKSSSLKQSAPGVIESEVPVIHFKPVEGKPHYHFSTVQIPIYKTKKRAGTLSTTGHSTNFIICVDTRSEQDENYWIKRGSAFICALDR